MSLRDGGRGGVFSLTGTDQKCQHTICYHQSRASFGTGLLLSVQDEGMDHIRHSAAVVDDAEERLSFMCVCLL